MGVEDGCRDLTLVGYKEGNFVGVEDGCRDLILVGYKEGNFVGYKEEILVG